MKKLFEDKKIARFANLFRPMAKGLLLFFPKTKVELKQAEYKVKPETFASICFYLAFMYSFLLTILLIVIIYILESFTISNIIFMILLGLIFLLFMFFTYMQAPKILLIKKGREIDVSLLFALRHMLIKIKSGIPLFDSIVGVAYGDYGAVSREFKEYVKQVQGGDSELLALERLGFYNPSNFFRRFTWQITNSLRAGTDVADTLSVIVASMESDRYIQIKTFGNRLSPIALMYIMMTIILPALGTTFLTVFSSFFGTRIDQAVFYLVPVIVIFSNIFFMTMIRSTRPYFEMN